MTNLIQNCHWRPDKHNNRSHFTSTGCTYDNGCIHGYRTCSVTIPAKVDKIITDSYVPSIIVEGKNNICWGFIIRALKAQSILLMADFYDKHKNLITSKRHQIAPCVSCCFHRQMTCFSIPCEAHTVFLSIQFCGQITDCTYFYPCAYFT